MYDRGYADELVKAYKCLGEYATETKLPEVTLTHYDEPTQIAAQIFLDDSNIHLNSAYHDILPWELSDTIGHEVAHHVSEHVYGHSGHGSFWKDIMKTFALPPMKRGEASPGIYTAIGKSRHKYMYICSNCGEIDTFSTDKYRSDVVNPDTKCFRCKTGQMVYYKELTKSGSIALYKNTYSRSINEHRVEFRKRGTKIGRARVLYKNFPNVKRKQWINLLAIVLNTSHYHSAKIYHQVKNENLARRA